MTPLKAPSKAFSKAQLDSHSLLGVIFGALLYLICFSGTLAVLIGEFSQWEAPTAPTVTAVTPGLIDAAAKAGYAEAKAAGHDHALYLTLPSADLPRLTVTGYDEMGGYSRWLADAEGRLHIALTPWSDFMRYHHYNLHLPGMVGYYLVGAAGVVMLALLISGLLAHRRILKDAFRLRLGGSGRLAAADLHNRFGVWALPFHLIVALTGALLGLAVLFMGLVATAAYDGDQTKAWQVLFPAGASEDHTSAAVPSIAQILKDLRSRTPDAGLTWIGYDHIGTRGQVVMVATHEPGHLSDGEIWTYGADGGFRAKAGYTDGSAGMRLYGMIAPLHFGTYGGVPLKLVYCGLGMTLSILVATGGTIWLRRRRDQGRDAPVLGRVWTAVVWGQPSAFALAALLSLTAGLSPLGTYWLVTGALLLLALGRKDGAGRLRLMLRLLGGMSLIMLAAIHLVHWPIAGPVPVLMDAALAGLGIILLKPLTECRAQKNTAEDSQIG